MNSLTVPIGATNGGSGELILANDGSAPTSPILINSNTLKVGFKKLNPEAELPTRAHEGDSGFDVKAIDDGKYFESGIGEDLFYYIEYRTGLAMELSPGWEAQARCRSSISKTCLYLCNGIGTIDSSYKGELLVRFRVDHGVAHEADLQNKKPAIYKKGDKIFQLVFKKVENVEIEEIADLSTTDRGGGGFGSTGK